MNLPSSYSPNSAEEGVRREWRLRGIFRVSQEDAPDDSPIFSFVLPPPNITGRLHIGHALNASLQDVLVRWRRMQGARVLWQPGLDHASIATQVLVEKSLRDKGRPSRQEMGREAFLQEVFKWKEEHGALIERQLEMLGVACDFSCSRFTMDEAFSKLVAEVFVALHAQGYVFRSKRLVNWDPALATAISDLEVVPVETEGSLYYIRYPRADAEGVVVVATTRPETLFGDVAVAVPPGDPRVGWQLRLPLLGRVIPVIADPHARAGLGSGAVKITPGHDFDDFEVGQRHHLAPINVFTPDMRLNESVPEAFRGLLREQARQEVLNCLERDGLIEKVEPHRHNVPRGDRSGAVIEPYLTDQWYLDARALAEASVQAVRNGSVSFFPGSWEKNYFEWMDNLQPWCISRQLWWGHRIPVWYARDDDKKTPFVAVSRSDAQREADRFFGRPVDLEQDPDVLDTWFSSALWPFAALEKNCRLGLDGRVCPTPVLRRYYPIDTLVTSFDIIFFWVARMMMMGVHFMGGVPFRRVYIHALVRDRKGQKMSKSKGNVVDPLGLSEKYGTDALRLCLLALTIQGRDIKLCEKQVESWRNFVTKVWNTARFCGMRGVSLGHLRSDTSPSLKHPINRWLMCERDLLVVSVTRALEDLRFNEAAQAVHHFTWHTFCDWYLEAVKSMLPSDGDWTISDERGETILTMGHVFGTILRLLHPFAPFVTDYIYRSFGADDLLVTQSWPVSSGVYTRERDVKCVEETMSLISYVRSLRAYFKRPHSDRLPLVCSAAIPHVELVKKLARLSSVTIDGSGQVCQAREGSKGSLACRFVLSGVRYSLVLGEDLDFGMEMDRLGEDIRRAEENIRRLSLLLANEAFLGKSKPGVVEEKRGELDENAKRLKELVAFRDAVGMV